MLQGRLGTASARTLYRIAPAIMVMALSMTAPQALWAQAQLENPGGGSFQSGIGVVSGWACNASKIEIVFDNTMKLQAGYGTIRTDTQKVCGDTNNGFSLLWK